MTDRRLTTDAVLDQELDLQRWAEIHTHPAPVGVADPRAAAVEAMAGTAGLVVVVGPAGAGKTTATAWAVRQLRTQGRPVLGLAPSGKAADVLATETRCPTDTVAGFLVRHQGDRRSPWPTGTTVILDEAAMTATEDLHRLVTLAHRHGWRLVAVGDPAQLPAVGRGGVFAHWCATVAHYELVVPRRFDHRWESDASLRLRTGDPQAVEAYEQHGRLGAAHPALIARQVAEAHQRQIAKGRTVAITTNTAETARAINTEIQRRLDPIGQRPRFRLSDGTQVAVGDQIATRRNDPNLRTDRRKQVRNRHTWTVATFDPDGAAVVSHPDRGTVRLPADYVARHVELGWAVTGYGNQGDTVDIGILEAGTTRNQAYVALTRGRRSNHAVIPDPTGTLDPADALTGMITREADSRSALATHIRLHNEAGVDAPALELDPSERGAAQLRGEPRNQSGGDAVPSDPGLDQRIRAMQARLDRLEHRSPHEIDRSLGR